MELTVSDSRCLSQHGVTVPPLVKHHTVLLSLVGHYGGSTTATLKRTKSKLDDLHACQLGSMTARHSLRCFSSGRVIAAAL